MHSHMSFKVFKSVYQLVKYEKFYFALLVFTSKKRMFWFLHILPFRFIKYFYILLSIFLICSPILNCYILSSWLKIGFAYLEFIFLRVLVFFFSREWILLMCVSYFWSIVEADCCRNVLYYFVYFYEDGKKL
jgi:hypothetical protein